MLDENAINIKFQGWFKNFFEGKISLEDEFGHGRVYNLKQEALQVLID